MRCYYCGKFCSDEYTFCPYCGKKTLEKTADPEPLNDLEQGESQESAEKEQVVEEETSKDKLKKNPENSPAPKKMGKKKKSGKKAGIAFAIIAILICCGIAGIYLCQQEKNKEIYQVNLVQMMEPPVVEGFNGYAKITKDAAMNQEKENEVIQGIGDIEYRKYMKKFLGSVTYTTEHSGDGSLSNEDKIQITIAYNKKYATKKNFIVSGTSTSYTVKDLEKGEDIAYKLGKFKDYDQDFAFPDSYRDYISDSDIKGSAMTVIQQGINEIYARHGYIFGDNDYGTYFESCEWYQPMYSEKNFKDKWLNDYEEVNLSKLGKYRSELKAQEAAVEKQKEEEKEAKKKQEQTEESKEKEK